MRKLFPALIASGLFCAASAALASGDEFGNASLTQGDGTATFWTPVPPLPFSISRIWEDVGPPGVRPAALHLLAVDEAFSIDGGRSISVLAGEGRSFFDLDLRGTKQGSDSVLPDADQMLLAAVPEPATNVLLVFGLIAIGGFTIFLGRKLG